jgi:hypothetical protein
MAGHSNYTAVLDACVLYPIALCDALLSVATTRLFSPKWTTAIEDEWMRNVAKDRPELAGKLLQRRDDMAKPSPIGKCLAKAGRACCVPLARMNCPTGTMRT